ncbi:MAG: hypothetical protein N3F05_02395 [Candidatus Diapherotrites archaeon]|nr:hypothetical protein [Candidatus Diapherotrites archaeon]
MQAIEVVIFFIFAFSVGMLVLAYIVGIDFTGLQKSITCLFIPDSCKEAIHSIQYQQFFIEISKCWRSCAFGARDVNCGVYNVKTEKVTGETFDLNALRAYFKKNKVCEDCNILIKNEPLVFPAIVELSCSDDLNSIFISN